MPYEVRTPVYEGPFDLLLHLILREEVALEQVFFRYGGGEDGGPAAPDEALRDVSMLVAPGQLAALVGPSESDCTAPLRKSMRTYRLTRRSPMKVVRSCFPARGRYGDAANGGA